MTDTPAESRYRDRYGLLLLTVAVTVLLLALVDLEAASGWSEFLAIVVTALTGLTLLFALLAAGTSRRTLTIALIVVSATIVGATIGAFTVRSTDLVTGGSVFWLLLVAATPVIVLRRLVSYEEVTMETLLGAVSVYLLMAVSFTYAFTAIDGVSLRLFDETFFGTAESSTSFMYFSLVTITTLGYGDLKPVTDFGRLAAASEAVAGSVYLVVVVARLVSLYSGESRRKRRRDADRSD